MQRRLKTALVVGVLALSACGLFESNDTARSALEAVAPQAVDALVKAVADRWGSDAAVDEDTAACFELPDEVGFQGIDEDYVYVLCRAKTAP